MKHLNVRKQVFRKLPIYTWPTVLFSVKWTNCWAELNYLPLTGKSEIVPEKTFQCLDCEIKKLLSRSLLSWAYKTYILNAMAFLLPWVLARGYRRTSCRKLCQQSYAVICHNIHWYCSDHMLVPPIPLWTSATSRKRENLTPSWRECGLLLTS